MKRISTRIFAIGFAAALACVICPAVALAANADFSDNQAGDKANSFRYQNGQLSQERAAKEFGWDGSGLKAADDQTAISLLALTDPPNTWHKDENGCWVGKDTQYEVRPVVNDACELGIDVSEHQGVINWKKVKAAGVTFAIIRCGYGDYYPDGRQTDEYWLANVKGAQSVGMRIGVYLYSYATNATGAKKEASHTLIELEKAGLSPKDLAYPVYYDVEEGYKDPKTGKEDGTPGVDGDDESARKKTLQKMVLAYTQIILDAGYRAGLYGGQYWYENWYGSAVLDNPDISIWVAQWPGYGCVGWRSSYQGKHDIWQCMSDGRVDGISDTVDMNFGYNREFAMWGEAPMTYKVKCVLNGGKNNAKNAATYVDQKGMKLYSPTRKGYTFKGWYSNKSCTKRVKSIPKFTRGKQTLYAKWELDTYYVQVKASYAKIYKKASTSSKAKGYLYYGKRVRLTEKKDGLGKLADGRGWIKLSKTKRAYKVTYKLNSGKNSAANPKYYHFAKKTSIKLKSPTRKGYTFKGWYSDKELTKRVKYIKKGAKGNLKLYAKWKRN